MLCVQSSAIAASPSAIVCCWSADEYYWAACSSTHQRRLRWEQRNSCPASVQGQRPAGAWHPHRVRSTLTTTDRHSTRIQNYVPYAYVWPAQHSCPELRALCICVTGTALVPRTTFLMHMYDRHSTRAQNHVPYAYVCLYTCTTIYLFGILKYEKTGVCGRATVVYTDHDNYNKDCTNNAWLTWSCWLLVTVRVSVNMLSTNAAWRFCLLLNGETWDWGSASSSLCLQQLGACGRGSVLLWAEYCHVRVCRRRVWVS